MIVYNDTIFDIFGYKYGVVCRGYRYAEVWIGTRSGPACEREKENRNEKKTMKLLEKSVFMHMCTSRKGEAGKKRA